MDRRSATSSSNVRHCVNDCSSSSANRRRPLGAEGRFNRNRRARRCLPARALVMYLAGIAYHIHGDRPVVTAMLKGVAAASTGLVLATIVQLGQKSLTSISDFIFVVITVVAVNQFHQSVPHVLLAVGFVAVLWYRPRREKPARPVP